MPEPTYKGRTRARIVELVGEHAAENYISFLDPDPVTNLDAARLDWLDEDPDRLQDVYYHSMNECADAREAIDALMGKS